MDSTKLEQKEVTAVSSVTEKSGSAPETSVVPKEENKGSLFAFGVKRKVEPTTAAAPTTATSKSNNKAKETTKPKSKRKKL